MIASGSSSCLAGGVRLQKQLSQQILLLHLAHDVLLSTQVIFNDIRRGSRWDYCPSLKPKHHNLKSMAKYKLEYIWLDGYKPVPNLRGKTQIKEFASFPKLEELPLWGFDGSSTQQAEGKSSDCVLKPVAVYPDSTRKNGALVMCEVMMPDGKTPHITNGRATILDDPGAWFGFEQEYFLYQDGRPLGFPENGFPKIGQGPYYCGAGYTYMGDVARQIVEEHLDLCLDAGINHEGINAEVAKGQWEFQIFGKGSKKCADEMWMARYILQRLCEKYGVDVEYHCKPLGDTDWNGSGMHANFSTDYLRETGGKEYFEKLMAAFDKYKEEHIAVYGPDNHMRLTGLHETQSIDKFSYGIADRGASIRVPHSFANNGYKGYLEDRRPNSQGDPYQIASRILKTIGTVPTA
ncbi:glutamine synthetase beta-grasp domain-containing protein [soil metagenome]